MTQIEDDERALRAALADLTAAPSCTPSDRNASVRRRVATTRRRWLAGTAAVVAILAVAAIPLALPGGDGHPAHRAKSPGGDNLASPPAKQPSYHITERPPGRGAPAGLVATGTLSGKRWQLDIWHGKGGSLCWSTAPGQNGSVCSGPGPQASRHSGPPALLVSAPGPGPSVGIGTVRSDVTRLTVAYSNGQVLTVRPVAALGRRYASYFALPVPFSNAVDKITAWSHGRDIGYAVPFAYGSLVLERWLRPGQAAGPTPAGGTIGSGTVGGTRWWVDVYLGPWGTCFFKAGNPGFDSSCNTATAWQPQPAGAVARISLVSLGDTSPYLLAGEVAPAVRYVVVTTPAGVTSRVRTTLVGSRRFFATAWPPDGNGYLRWAAFSGSGRELGSGRVRY